MKIAIFSDTHGNTDGMIRAVRRVSPDMLVHLGDNIRDCAELQKEFPYIPLYAVSGNCDYTSRQPDTITFMAGSVKVFATHGHRYSVKQGLDSLLNAGFFSGAVLVLYGHTHKARFEQVSGMKLLNPGTAGKGDALTFAVAEITDNGDVSCRIINI